MLLRDKVAVVTGANRGIGKAIATRFRDEGATVVGLVRSEGSLNESGMESYTCDVSDPKQVKAVFQEIMKAHGGIDILVNNAGVLADSLLGFVTEDLLEKTYKTNTFGPLYTAQYAARLMMKKGGGSIINMTSIMGVEGSKGQTVYAGTKAALIGFTKSLAEELGEHQIRVNAIAPGFIGTDMLSGVSESIREERTGRIALGRVGRPEDVADVAVFLASDLSRYVTSDVIAVDGGMRL